MKYSELTGLGLTKGEAKVYIALLKLGSTTAGPIVKESKIAYSNIYEVLERLIDKGLVSFIIKEKTKYFQATEPYRLKEYLENKEKQIQEQKEKLEAIMPNILSLKKAKESELDAEVFSGMKAVKTAFLKLVGEETKGDYNFFYTNYEDDYERVDDFFLSLIPTFKKPKIKYKGLSDKKYKKSKFVKEAKFVKMKFVDFPIIGNLDIFNNKVLITTWTEKPTSVLIHSKEIADYLTKYFEFVWKSAK